MLLTTSSGRAASLTAFGSFRHPRQHLCRAWQQARRGPRKARARGVRGCTLRARADRERRMAKLIGPALLLLRAVAHRVPELLGLLDGGRLELRADHVAHRWDPVRNNSPLLAVPLLEHHGATALVILAADFDGMREALHAELVEALLGEIQVLEPPARLLAGERLVAVLAHGRADRFGAEHRVDDAAIVEHLADAPLLAGALALVVDELDDVRMHLEAAARRVKGRADVT